MLSENPNRFDNITANDIRRFVKATQSFIDATASIFNGLLGTPLSPNSKAGQEQAVFPDRKLIVDAHSRGILSIEAAVDHLMLFVKGCTEPAQTISTWTSVRGLLESCAVAFWLLDSDIDSKERIKRYFAFRYQGLNEQVKILRKQNRQAEVSRGLQTIAKVEQRAINLGFARLRTQQNEIKAIGIVMPKITELIESTLGREIDYKRLSAIAHGHHWAISQVAFRVSDFEDDGGMLVAEKKMIPIMVISLTQISVTSLSKVLWELWKLNDWDRTDIENQFEKTYDELNYPSEIRFWRP